MNGSDDDIDNSGFPNGASHEAFEDFGIDVHEPAILPESQGAVNGVGYVEALASDPVVTVTASEVAATALTRVSDSLPVVQVPESGKVTFSVSGSFSLDDLSHTDALTTIRAAVELLREHGSVRCRVTVPSTFDL